MSSLNDPVCRNCGSDELGTVEHGVEWRHATFARGAADWQVEEHGDEVGDGEWTTVGVVCTNCHWTAEGEKSKFSDLITTRSAYNRGHPVIEWWVIQERYLPRPADHVVGQPLPTEQRRRRVKGRDIREAEAAGWDHIAGEYPWHPKGLWPGWPHTEPNHWLWPVGTKRPLEPGRRAA